MFRQILKDSILLITHDLKLIRLSFITTFSHSLIVMIMLIYYVNSILVYRFEKWFSTGEFVQTLVKWISENNITGIVIVVWIILAIWYSILYPMGQAGMIRYLKSEKKSISKSLAKGAGDFFTMFEFNALSLSFGAMTFIFTILRLTMLEVLDNVFIIILISIWFFCVLFAGLFWPYTRLAIVLEGMPVFEAIKRSVSLSLSNFGVTFRFVFLEAILLIRFFINVLVIIGIPFIILYLAILLNVVGSGLIDFLIYFTGIWLLLIATYINAIIDAFFATYRYKVYERIKYEDEDEE